MAEQRTTIIDPLSNKQLFLDDYAIENLHGLVKVLHQPKKCGTVIAPDRSKGQTMVQSSTSPNWNPDINRWEWWYAGFYDEAPVQGPVDPVWGDYHYTTSIDGINWEYPTLGLYEWRGSWENNLAYHSRLDFIRRRGEKNPPDIEERRFHHIIRDQNDPDENRRYKGLFSNSGLQRRYPAFSPDGFKWLFPHVDGIYSEDTSQMIFDNIQNQFVATLKKRTEWGRSLWLSTSKDFLEWTDPQLVLHTDEIDQINRKERIKKAVEDPDYLSPPTIDSEADYIAQLYMMPLMTYEGIYVGFPLLFNPAGPDLPQMNHCGLNQTELAMSRDLYEWKRVADRSIFLGIDPWDGKNYDTCQVAVTGAPIVRNNEIWIYYEGARFRGVAESYPEKFRPYFKDMGALELAKLRLDGFVSLTAKNTGEFLTKPFNVTNETLKINVNASKGQLEVEILDAKTLEPLPNLSFSNCDPIRSDNIDTLVTWKGLSLLNYGTPVRASFRLQKSEIYSFWTEKKK